MSTSITINNIDHFGIHVTDLEVSANWYANVFDFKILHKWTTTWMVGKGNTKIGLFLRKSAIPVQNIDEKVLISHIAFAVDGDKFPNTVKALIKLGLHVEGPEDSGIAKSVFFKDPDGHQLEITSYYHSKTDEGKVAEISESVCTDRFAR